MLYAFTQHPYIYRNLSIHKSTGNTCNQLTQCLLEARIEVAEIPEVEETRQEAKGALDPIPQLIRLHDLIALIGLPGHRDPAVHRKRVVKEQVPPVALLSKVRIVHHHMEALLLPEADHMPEVDQPPEVDRLLGADQLLEAGQLPEAKAAMRVPPELGLVARLDQPTESEFNINLYTKHR